MPAIELAGRVQTEEQVSEMVVKAALPAKIDRPAGIIRFGAVKRPEQVRTFFMLVQ